MKQIISQKNKVKDKDKNKKKVNDEYSESDEYDEYSESGEYDENSESDGYDDQKCEKQENEEENKNLNNDQIAYLDMDDMNNKLQNNGIYDIFGFEKVFKILQQLFETKEGKTKPRIKIDFLKPQILIENPGQKSDQQYGAFVLDNDIKSNCQKKLANFNFEDKDEEQNEKIIEQEKIIKCLICEKNMEQIKNLNKCLENYKIQIQEKEQIIFNCQQCYKNVFIVNEDSFYYCQQCFNGKNDQLFQQNIQIQCGKCIDINQISKKQKENEEKNEEYAIQSEGNESNESSDYDSESESQSEEYDSYDDSYDEDEDENEDEDDDDRHQEQKKYS
ncbi:hypothetical protein PPERSA_12187 [Pseudocohnilembus persalinus]|uniref:Uncharacterized protein n=1 Tax=Pseudocohnilembus persalinus TaxID=266149 RepID=A0A0V0R8L6_PSEPJ|nr:hypothetical protein PPERSA_12187 [Pseudocohnilembus persalinus]|eukprot:KRX10836.1 hypothetical protein PPERSA_12187 [Pseudocohnilembus persalinus]